MVTKLIYFQVGNKNEQAEFLSKSSLEDVKNIFRMAGEAQASDILKLYNSKGNVVAISNKLPTNTPDTRYKLEIITYDCDYNVGPQLYVDVGNFEDRIENLEKKIFFIGYTIPANIYDMKMKMEELQEKLDNVEHLSWLGLFKNVVYGTRDNMQPFWNRNIPFRKSIALTKPTFERFLKIGHIQMDKDIRVSLQKATFNNWEWKDEEMMLLIQQMFIDLKLISTFKIELPVLQRFIYEVYIYYNNVPFHNFRHCFAVAQMIYALIWMAELQGRVSDLDILTLLVSSICHDLDHPGYNNAYQVNAQTQLALHYNDISPLENHHCSVTFEILAKNHCNIFRNLDISDFRNAREAVIRCILATDMGRHAEILNKFRACAPTFDFTNSEHRITLSMILIKVSDVSNEARPLDVAEPWLNSLLQEFFNQSDAEKLEGLPVAPFMDRNLVTKPSAQIGFIRFVLLPLFDALAEVFPIMGSELVVPVNRALDYFVSMGKE